jgi:hypothetical protein
MEWLNLHIARTLRSPEVIGSSPAERGTWLMVVAYCAEQENGGRLAGGATWKDRQWQQTCGVTLREIQAAKRLLSIESGDIIVRHYPVDKQKIVQQNREIGRVGGRARTEDKSEAARRNGASGGRPNNPSENPSETEEETQAKTQALDDEEPKRKPNGIGIGIGIGKSIDKHARGNLVDMGQVQAVFDAYPTARANGQGSTQKDGQSFLLLALAMPDSPDHPWLEHAKLVAETEPMPKNFENWIRHQPDTIGLESLRAAAAAGKETDAPHARNVPPSSRQDRSTRESAAWETVA